ncbi:MAG: PAS domain S-box protein [Gemmatimonadaceae bacterium]|nr:PAS domain S-box protein [Gemmatimonadaceae bacterium]
MAFESALPAGVSADLARALFEHSPFSTVVYDRDGRIVAVNAAFEKLFGLTRRTIPPGYSVLTDPQLEAAGYLPAVRRAFQGEAVILPLVFYDAAALDGVGRSSWTQGHFLPMRDATGALTGVALMHVDLTERVESEEARRLSEERLLAQSELARAQVTATLESIGDAFYAIDADFRFTYVNRQAEALWGRARETLLGRHYWTEFPQAVGSEAYRQHLVVMRERRPAHFEAVSPVIGRWVEVSLYPDDATGGLACYFRDITERKAAEAALRESEARFRLMADAVPQIVWITDDQGRTEFFNRQWTAYTGAAFDPGTAAQIAADYVHPDDAAITLERFDEARRTGRVFEVEHRIRSAAGDYRWFLVRAEPYRDPDTGEIVRWFGGSVDIHDRKQAEAERERLLAAERSARAEADSARATAVANERRLAAVIAHLPIGVTFAEAPGGRHSVSNPAAVAIWGVVPASPAVDAYSRDFVGFRPGPGAPGSAEERARQLASEEWPLARALVKGEVVRDELTEIERPDGTRRLVSLSAAPVRDADGRVDGALVTTVDVTERERLLADAQAARREAEAANRAKSEFLAVMSHELRTPLNAIGGYAELLEMGIRGPVTPQQREDLARIQRSQRHLLGLINEVLNYAKVEMGVVHYDLADVCVRDVLAAAEGLVAPQARAKGLVLTVTDSPADLSVHADADKLRQILVNLLSNAIKFTDTGGRIVLSCEASSDGTVRLRVSDTGVGIPADKLEVIFDPFVQVRSDLTRTAEGAGLGLAISRDLARDMGGDLTVESTTGAGSTFTLTLQRA